MRIPEAPRLPYTATVLVTRGGSAVEGKSSTRVATDQRSARRDEVRGAILAAARTALRNDGPMGVAVRGVCRDAGVPATSFYRHFPDRVALMNQLRVEAYTTLAARVRQALQTCAPGDHQAECRAAARATRRWSHESRDDFYLLYGETHAEWQADQRVCGLRITTGLLVGTVLERAIATGQLAPRKPTAGLHDPTEAWRADDGPLSPIAHELTMHFWAAVVGFLMLEPCRGSEIVDPEAFFESYLDLLMAGMGFAVD
nr:TetR/AcrR family transcriptional regulator [Flexivirga meconopsidis]